MSAFEWWMLTAGANGILVLIYGAIAIIMLRGLIQGHQWFSNPIATATFAIFVACTVGHGIHLEHALLPVTVAYVGGDPAQVASTAAAVQATFADPRLFAWDVFTAGVAIWYWTLRSRFALIFKGAALCEDMAKRQQQALELHDNVVQGLSRAKLALDLGQRDEGEAAIAETLEEAKGIISGLLGREQTGGVRLGAGDLRRKVAGH